jgi:hypothetical protein
MLKTSLCDLFGIEVPIILAPMGTCTSAELAAAVSNEGGLGGIGTLFRTTTAIKRDIDIDARLNQCSVLARASIFACLRAAEKNGDLTEVSASPDGRLGAVDRHDFNLEIDWIDSGVPSATRCERYHCEQLGKS